MTYITFLIVPYHLTTNSPNQNSHNLSKMVIFSSFLAITPVWDLIETWGFCVDDVCCFPDTPISPQHKFTKTKITQPLKNCYFEISWSLVQFGTWERPQTKITQPLKNGDFGSFFSITHLKFTKPKITIFRRLWDPYWNHKFGPIWMMMTITGKSGIFKKTARV